MVLFSRFASVMSTSSHLAKNAGRQTTAEARSQENNSVSKETWGTQHGNKHGMPDYEKMPTITISHKHVLVLHIETLLVVQQCLKIMLTLFL